VFKVEYLSSYYLYYAFKLDDYIFCPAILANSLEITNYACLNVEYSTEYLYIFVKPEIGDLDLNIAGDYLDFRGEYILDLLLKQQKVLNLTFQDAFLQVFINFENPQVNWV
jgi:hypothetical protein